MAVWQLFIGAKVDQRADIYSLACVMYESIVGKPPFSGETAFETMYEHLKKSVPKLTELSGSLGISRSLFELIVEALSKDPAKRPQSMLEFRQRVVLALSKNDIAMPLLKPSVSFRRGVQQVSKEEFSKD